MAGNADTKNLIAADTKDNVEAIGGLTRGRKQQVLSPSHFIRFIHQLAAGYSSS